MILPFSRRYETAANSQTVYKMDLVESEDSYILAREFGDKCFSITSFFTFLMVIMTTIVNVNSNMVRYFRILNDRHIY